MMIAGFHKAGRLCASWPLRAGEHTHACRKGCGTAVSHLLALNACADAVCKLLLQLLQFISQGLQGTLIAHLGVVKWWGGGA
jgi:hypothetical protein